MKLVKLVLVGAIGTFALAPRAYAFHSGGVAECEGCHSMHNSLEGAPNVTGKPTQFVGARYLLKAQDQSGTCLNCHNAPDTAPSSYHVSTDESKIGPGLPPIQQTPGGDFAWLKVTRSFFVRGTLTTDHGERRGHNIVAQDFGYLPDSTHAVGPGGTYPANKLACISCHDPHGRYRRDAAGNIGTPNGLGSGWPGGPATIDVKLPIFNSGSYDSSADPIAGVAAVGVYRLLAGKGYSPMSMSGANAFTTDAPAAVAPATYNRTESSTITRVAYGKGMSEWCGNCHGNIHLDSYTSGADNLRHPAGNDAKLTPAVIANYNSYVTSGILTGTRDTAYSTLAPFELGTADYAVLKPLAKNDGSGNSKQGPDPAGTANVMCLSCHRAHASAFESMTRFFRGNEFGTVADAANQAKYADDVTDGRVSRGLSSYEQQIAYYGRPATAFGPYARNYCNKCHAKD